MSSQKRHPQIFRRRVFYIPGYDPFPPRRYRELYRAEGRAQAEISGYSVSIAGRTGPGPYGWHVTSLQENTEIQTEFEVLAWSDIVQGSMAQSVPATYFRLARTAWVYISTGALRRLMRLRKGPVIAALYPVGMLLLQLAVAVLVLLGCHALLSPVMGALSWVPAVAVAYAILLLFRRLDNRLFAYYLMLDYAHSAHLYGAVSPDLDDRLSQFADRIEQALAEGLDEVLVVGHSSGAHLGVMVLADVLQRRSALAHKPSLSFLTLGQVVPMVSFLPKAQRLRGDLQLVSVSPDVTWVDVSAPGDGCTFALCDPVGVSGVASPDQRWPLILSAAFTQTLSPDRWKALRWRFFRLHFQYLCAFDQPGDYDYFRITAGPKTLRQRFEARAPSRSRITNAVSKYTSVQA
ncbi:MAG: hypothetical protein AB3N07_08740 [Ruegeria sp.]